MNTVVGVCIITITIFLVFLVVMSVMALKDIRRVRVKIERFLDTIEHEVNPLLSEIRKVTEDVREITHTARNQVAKVDSTTDFISQNLNSTIDKWINTIDTLHDAVAEPAGDIATFLKGVSQGVRFFFYNGRDNKGK